MTKTKLTPADYRQIDRIAEIEAEALLGPPPTLETLDKAGYMGKRLLSGLLDFIAGAGTVVTMVAAELIQAVAALALMIVFALLEAERIHAGALALGQSPDQAALIAAALVTANAVTPIYSLRNLRGQTIVKRTRSTLRGWLVLFARRLFARPETYSVHVHDNPTLRVAKAALLWSTVGFALLAILGPMIAQRAGEVWYRALAGMIASSNLAEFVQIVAGVLVSFGGVFFLQSAAHEVGVRVLTDKPDSVQDMLAEQQRAYQAAAAGIHREIAAEYAAGKIADLERKTRQEQEPAAPFSPNGRR